MRMPLPSIKAHVNVTKMVTVIGPNAHEFQERINQFILLVINFIPLFFYIFKTSTVIFKVLLIHISPETPLTFTFS